MDKNRRIGNSPHTCRSIFASICLDVCIAHILNLCTHTDIYIYIYIYQFTRSPPLTKLAEQPAIAPLLLCDRNVGLGRIANQIKNSLDLHKFERSPDHRVCALPLPTIATSIRTNTSDERCKQDQKSSMGSGTEGDGSSMGSSSRGAAPSRAISSRSAARKAASGAAFALGRRGPA